MRGENQSLNISFEHVVALTRRIGQSRPSKDLSFATLGPTGLTIEEERSLRAAYDKCYAEAERRIVSGEDSRPPVFIIGRNRVGQLNADVKATEDGGLALDVAEGSGGGVIQSVEREGKSI